MNKILLDTNAFTRFLAGDERVLSYLGQAEKVYMSVFVLGELFAGFKARGKERQNKQILERFLLKSTVNVLEASKGTAEIFGFIKEALRKSGNPIPVNDIWIAAHALETGSVLITYDSRFLSIPGLRVWDELSQ